MSYDKRSRGVVLAYGHGLVLAGPANELLKWRVGVEETERHRTNGEPLLIAGGPILTMAQEEMAQAVVTSCGRIRCVGSLAKCREAAGPAFRELNLGGRCLMPGFVEAHGHMLMWGTMAMMADLRWPGVRDIDQLVMKLKDHACTLPRGATVRGFGYDQHLLLEGRHPVAADLDRVALDRTGAHPA